MLQEIKELLSKQLKIDIEKIEDDTNIIEDLGADSLDIVEMLMTIEDKYGIIVPDEDVMKLKTVKGVSEYIQSKKG